MIYDFFVENIKQKALIGKKSSVLCCVSGGADSMTLLDLFLRFFKDDKSKLQVAHVNHNLRGDYSLRDQKFVEEFCQKNDIIFHCKSLNIKQLAEDEGLSIEDCGRKYRYAFFRQIASGMKDCKIALAHNLDDQAETVLMRIIRGTGIDGLEGIHEKDGDIIRPILHVSREDIESYVELNSIEYVQDHTNFENDYTRNKIRNILIPQIETEYNPQFKLALVKLSKIAADENKLKSSYIDRIFHESIVKSTKNSLYLGVLRLSMMEDYEKIEIIRKSIEVLRGSLYGFDYSHFEEFRKLMHSTTGKEMTIQGINVSVSFGNLIVRNVIKNDLNKDITIFHSGTYYVNGFTIEIGLKDSQVIIRRRKDGDKIFSRSKNRKLKDYLIDKKIDKFLREYLPIIEKDNEILAVGNIYKNYSLLNEYDIKIKINGGKYV